MIIKSPVPLFSSPVFCIMFHMGIIDCIQLSVHTIGGIFSLAQSTFDPWANKIFGGIVNGTWIGVGPFTLLLALNRLVLVCFPAKMGIFFHKRALLAQLVVCWSFPSMFFIMYMTPLCGVIYNITSFGWEYDESPWSQTVSDVELYSLSFMLAVSVACYLCIFYKTHILRRTIKVHMTSVSTRNYVKINGTEAKILIQAVVITFYTTTFLVGWHVYGLYLPDWKWAEFFFNLMWIFNCGIYPCLHITLIPVIRRSVWDVIRCRKPNSARVSTVLRHGAGS
ncbi:hypothetical protein QR680_004056 [Steinernema hermaphroditum]|uniref:7TM GPCR serpentine receptor class x (Srx) domain-containing protein n=1 Tax=Steinernema hermaphroditum TaxID=289476 RepID=A0AA39HPQ6_9BILA|nr:hypothetical protein QR680_004056 [Steinernema hermaphroditum]